MEQIARISQQIGAAVRRVRRRQNLTQGALGAMGLERVIRPRTRTDPADFETIF
jgi:hypothetical protein